MKHRTDEGVRPTNSSNGITTNGLPRTPVAAQVVQNRTQRTIQPRGNGSAVQLPAHLSSFPRSGGQRLPDAVHQRMESFFGTNFSDVRVHVGHEATSIRALAFTHGSNLYFAPGQYNPNSAHGLQLLGHELTHVMQRHQPSDRSVLQERLPAPDAEPRPVVAPHWFEPGLPVNGGEFDANLKPLPSDVLERSGESRTGRGRSQQRS